MDVFAIGFRLIASLPLELCSGPADYIQPPLGYMVK